MADPTTAPQGNPGDILNWPMLKVNYRTDAECIAKLLPPGLSVGAEPIVRLTFYNFPVQGEPEYGIVINVDADYDGVAGEYCLGFGIDQEQAIFISREKTGQPKFPAETSYYRLMNYVSAKTTHQGHTFAEFKGEVVGVEDNGPEFELNEWWIKCSRAVDDQPESYDFPPHVVKVFTKYGTAYKEKVQGQLILRDSPWDPIASQLPMREQLDAYLWTPIFLDRKITLEGALDPKGFWPFADTIGGSRWLGDQGGPKKS
ncbi:MAG: acetoacetate decarboxylase [Cellvibrionales bacterium]|nr:acetoacetate decarboxylase [Cellvibrionales bacterium]|tara:strand:- start:12249 stop:13022 length:774 start_codon:yes stop_codon:yes gene_type:complete